MKQKHKLQNGARVRVRLRQRAYELGRPEFFEQPRLPLGSWGLKAIVSFHLMHGSLTFMMQQYKYSMFLTFLLSLSFLCLCFLPFLCFFGVVSYNDVEQNIKYFNSASGGAMFIY